jgi:hypothetical protein
VGDGDQDGIPDVIVKFPREALDPLLAPGVNLLEVSGSLITGEQFRAFDPVSVIPTQPLTLSASVSPNPLNPAGVLRFRAPSAGPVSVTIFDAQGRVVRRLLNKAPFPAGTHVVSFEGRNEAGEVLATGIYFYRVETISEEVSGRFTMLK